MKRFFQAIAGTLTATALLGAPVVAEDFPNRPITMIIPLGAGGSHDLNARVITSVLPSYLGQPVVVQLMPGASGQTGTAAAAQAPADGYTLLFTHNFVDQVQQFVANLPYSPNEDFVTVARVNSGPPALIVREDSPYQTFEELVEYGQANPGVLNFGHSGNWGAFMIPGLALMQEVGVQTNVVPYQGGGPALQALLAGDIDFTFALPSVLTGQPVRPLLIVGDEEVLEGVPTTTELGYDLVSNIGLMHRPVLAPAGIPEDRLAILRQAFAELSEDPTFITLMERLGENTSMIAGDVYDQMRLEQAVAYDALIRSFTE